MGWLDIESHKDENGRRLTQANLCPLFDDSIEPDDIPSGTIYVRFDSAFSEFAWNCEQNWLTTLVIPC